MYNFKDTVPSQREDLVLPSEAISIDGVLLDRAISGYRTLWVSGRETLDMDYDTERISNIYKMTEHYQNMRVLEVGYQILADSASELMSINNILNGYLDFRDSRISFNDEMDKYFVGTKSTSSTPPKGVLSYTSSFEIVCVDPHKYATTETTVTATPNADGVLEATITNDGTAEVPISYEITHTSDNGYVGIVSEYGAMEFGSREELDGEDYQANEQVFSTDTFSDWLPDTGPNSQNSHFATNGTLIEKVVDGKNTLSLNNLGSGSYWHGGQRSLILPADSQGDFGSENFYSYFNTVFQTGLIPQTGLFVLSFVDEDGKNICSYTITKNSTNSNYANVQFYCGDKHYESINFFASNNNNDNQFASVSGHCSISKTGDFIEFYWRGKPGHGWHVPELKDKKCVKIQVYIAQHGTRTLSDNDYITRNFLRSISFVKVNVDKWRDVPNRYSNGTIVTIDGETKRPYVNGMLALDDEVIGTQYFKLPVGESKIQFYPSPWCVTPPEIKIRYRKAWL